MAKKGHFPTTPYEGYYHRDVPKEDEELTHVGPGTPGGEYLRRFWQPVALSEELKDLPKKIRIMCEDLVVFRDFSGKTGLLALHCSHRGTSLEFGLVSERGIRCCYHGWLYDTDGRILEIPGQAVKSDYKDRLYHPAYPTLEYKGLVFAYMGPPEKKPPFPIYDTFELPDHEIVPFKPIIQPCNWIQNKENQMDPIHVSFLHMIVSGAQLAEGHAEIPELDWIVTPIGMAYMATRRMGENVWVRMADSILPNIAQFGSTSEDGTRVKIFSRPQGINWGVPIDDTNMILFAFKLYRIVGGKHVDPADPKTFIISQAGDRPYEEMQRQPSDYEAQTSQRPIAVHALEHLVGSDRGVIMFRKLIREGIRDVKNGRDPNGIFRRLSSGQVIPTYCQDTVVRIPRAPTPEADKKLIQQIGWKVAKGEIKSDLAFAGNSIPETVGT
jgi:phenylpropionate dioxygenase-like ring-hydroxylating dioxygenase large terminal subunit